MATKLKNLSLDELSLVDVPANSQAQVSIFKRATGVEDDQLVNTITKIGHTFMEHMRREEFDKESWHLMDALRQSMRDAIAVGSQDMMRQSVMEFVETMREKFPNVEAQLQKGVDMSIEELQKKLEKAEALASMSDAEKEFMKSLDSSGQEAFMKSKPEERVEAMKVAKAADESITVNGHEVKKSAVGAGMFEIIKSQQAELQAQKDAIAKSNEQLEMERLTKRASDEFEHLPGKPEEIAAVLKHVGNMPEDVQGTINAIMKAANESTGGAFVSKGHSGANTPVHNNATEKLDELAKKYAEDYKVDYPTAYDAVITKHANLYEESINEGH